MIIIGYFFKNFVKLILVSDISTKYKSSILAVQFVNVYIIFFDSVVMFFLLIRLVTFEDTYVVPPTVSVKSQHLLPLLVPCQQ